MSEPIQRCYAVADGAKYFGEVYGKNSNALLFVDPEHPKLQPQSQWTWTGTSNHAVIFQF